VEHTLKLAIVNSWHRY